MARQQAERLAGDALPASQASLSRRRSPGDWAVFASLRHRNYLLLWIGSLVSNTGDWMDQVALNWLVWTLTKDPAALGLLNACRGLPILAFTLFGGALADRIERRRLLQSTQLLGMALAFVLAGLVWTGSIEFWQVLLLGTLRGVLLSFNQPTRQALVSELVPRADLLNAVALNSATMNMTRVFGGALGGVLIGLFGVAGCFFLNGLSFVAVIWALALMEIPPQPAGRPRQGILRAVGAGLAYIRSEPALAGLVLAGLVPMIFGMPYLTLLPIFADQVLRIGNTGYGFMVALTGVGALAGALTVASLRDFRHKGRLMLAVMTGFGAMLVLFALSDWTPLSLVLLLGVGCGSTGYLAVNNTLLQVNSTAEMRGRVMSVFFLNRGLVPLGTMVAGLAAGAIGAPLTVAVMGGVIIVLALIIAVRLPVIRALE